MQFVLESIALCIMGGLLGLLLVYILSVIITDTSDFKVTLYLKNIITGLSWSLAIGFIAGFWPAYSASRLDPVEAIRS